MKTAVLFGVDDKTVTTERDYWFPAQAATPPTQNWQ